MALLYFMAMDQRVKAGVSSCGIFEIGDYFAEGTPTKISSMFAIPGLSDYGEHSDYLGMIAPRPVLITRGINEFGNSNETQRKKSLQHLNSTKRMVEKAKGYYNVKNATNNLQTIYFDEGEG